MSEWQPIETAPKDGTRVLVSFCSTSNAQFVVADATWHRDHWWRDGDGVINPTYWMPLPAAPKAT